MLAISDIALNYSADRDSVDYYSVPLSVQDARRKAGLTVLLH